MKKYLILISLFIISLSSCVKTNVNQSQAVIDDEKIQAYIKANNITGMTKDPSGYYYKIVTAGGTSHPNAISNVQVTYTSTWLNGLAFQTLDVFTYKMPQLPRGLQLAIPRIGVGGRIFLIVPSGLLYGITPPTVDYPLNTSLVYTLDLIGFN